MMLVALVALALAAAPPTLAAPAEPSGSGAPSDTQRLGSWPDAPSGRTVTLSDHDLTVDEALERIADAAGWGLVLHTGSEGEREVTARLRDAPVEEALDAVLQGTRLLATRRGQLVTISPPATSDAGPLLSGFEAPTGRRFSGELADEPVDAALRRVAEAAGLSVVLPPGLKGAVSGHFAGAPVEDVLRALLRQAGLVAARQGQVLVVERSGGPSLVVEGSRRTLRFDVEPTPGGGATGGLSLDLPDRSSEGRGERRPRRARGERRSDGVAKTTFRGDHTVGPGERAGEVTVIGGNIRLAPSAQARQVTAVGGSVEIGQGAEVEGEAVAIGGDVQVRSGATVGGQAVSVGGRVIIEPGGLVEGEEVSLRIPGVASLVGLLGGHPLTRPPLAWRLGTALAQFAVFFLLALLVQAVMPRRLDAVGAALVRSPVRSLLAGILGTLALPVIALLLVVTVVGIPFLAVVALGVLAATVVGFAALALRLGRAVPLRLERGLPVLQLALGTAALVLLGQIPVLGPLTLVAAWFALFGVVMWTRFGEPPGPALVASQPPPPATTRPV